mmetsp:Transcript_25843/g.50648  ORF Transcript_25843/g.50648 Transcript_25843/m.50648 type:complete len:138 (-) Transcript_25843:448-861(-)
MRVVTYGRTFLHLCVLGARPFLRCGLSFPLAETEKEDEKHGRQQRGRVVGDMQEWKQTRKMLTSRVCIRAWVDGLMERREEKRYDGGRARRTVTCGSPLLSILAFACSFLSLPAYVIRMHRLQVFSFFWRFVLKYAG